MLSEMDSFYSKQAEPAKSCLVVLKEIILQHDKEITAAWKRVSTASGDLHVSSSDYRLSDCYV